jgi:hypothetical protein
MFMACGQPNFMINNYLFQSKDLDYCWKKFLDKYREGL